MGYRKLNDILDNDWDEGNCTKPSIVRGYRYSAFEYTRVVTVERISITDAAMGIISRNKYEPQSHEAWACNIISTTESDMNDMMEEIKRIIVTHIPENDARILDWQGGDIPLAYGGMRWEFRFIVIKRKSGVVIG